MVAKVIVFCDMTNYLIIKSVSCPFVSPFYKKYFFSLKYLSLCHPPLNISELGVTDGVTVVTEKDEK